MKLPRSILFTAVLASGVLLTTTATAQQQSQQQARGYAAYNHLSIGIDDHDGGESIVVEGAYEFNSPYYVSGYYRNYDNDGSGSGDALNLKLARYFWLSSGLTADAGVRVGQVDFGPVDSNFWGLEANLRQRIKQFEFYGGLGWIDYSDAGSDNQYQIGVNYYLDSRTSVGIGYQDSEYGDGIRFRGSYHF